MQVKELLFTQQLHQRSSSTSIDKDKATCADGTSYATNRSSNASKNFSVLKRIELDSKKAEHQFLKDIAYAKARKAKATAEAEVGRAQAEADDEEALARLRWESANLEAEEKFLRMIHRCVLN